jgi:hypothetical protein
MIPIRAGEEFCAGSNGRECAVVDQPGRIVVAGLSKSFEAVRAVDNLSFTVEPGR